MEFVPTRRRGSFAFLLRKNHCSARSSPRRQQSPGLAGDLSRMVSPGCIAAKAPLCKGGCHANSVTGGLSHHSICWQQYRSTLQSLSQKSEIFASSLYTREPFSVAPHSTTPPATPVVSKCALYLYLFLWFVSPRR